MKYPGLEDHPTHANAKKYFGDQFGGMVVFGIAFAGVVAILNRMHTDD